MRTYKTEGLIIKRRNYKDSDRILTIFTKDQGKITVKAAGVRKITSRRSSHIELLNYVNLTLYKSPSGFPILTEAGVIDSFSSVKQDLDKVGMAYHLCELIDGLCPEHQENIPAFLLFKRTLSQLSQSSSADELRLIIRHFEIELLSQLGYWHQERSMPLRMDTQEFIENIMERKLKSKKIFAKL